MTKPKGVRAPFFLPAASRPDLRDDALLKQSLEAYGQGRFGDALVGAESVCRRLPASSEPAILRAKILEACQPALAAKAWHAAWQRDTQSAMLQDAMLGAWLRAGAQRQVAALGPAFLPLRCRQGTHEPLLRLLHQAGQVQAGACWREGQAIEGMFFGGGKRVALTVSGETGEPLHQEVPGDGTLFRIEPPRTGGTWSVVAPGGRLLPGSPVAFPREAPAAAPKRARQARGVDIVIPVYEGLASVQRCIASVLDSLQRNSTTARVTVIDDATPDARLAGWLDQLAQAGRITLLRNRFNLGFIATVNRALRRDSANDVLMLNADTEVQGDWIDRLRAALHAAPDIASVMPWSNHGDMGSLRRPGAQDAMPGAALLRQIDGTAARLRAGGRTGDIELPSCCGFAMLMRRQALDEVGVLDDVTLARGYLEETDWCLRARAAGWRHLLATGVFVSHKGSESFGVEKTLRVQQNKAVLAARYPWRDGEYKRFLVQGSLEAARTVLQDALSAAGVQWDTNKRDEAGVAGLPAPLPCGSRRIGVWQHRLASAHAGQLLSLARRMAAQPAAARLLVIGQVDEALWHTGVVDAMPPAAQTSGALFSDAAMLGLSGCSLLLSDGSAPAPEGIAQSRLDSESDSDQAMVAVAA